MEAVLFSTGSLIISYFEISHLIFFANFSITDLSPTKIGSIKPSFTACWVDSIETDLPALTITTFTGPLFLVLKPSLFVGKNYIKRIKENIRTVKKLPKIKGVNEILYPGQGMISRYKKNLKKDIVVPKNILEDLKKLNVVK